MKKKLFLILIILVLGMVGHSRVGDIILLNEWMVNNEAFTKHENYTIQDIELTGKVALLIDELNNTVLYEKRANKRIYPASTTKILTALLALKYGNMDDRVTVGTEIEPQETGESTAYLVLGDTYTIRELLAGLMLPSGNDAARAIAVYIGKIIANDERLSNVQATTVFVDEMNAYAKKIGAENSNFINSNGLHEPGHYTTAYDMAIITLAAIKEKEFMQVVSQSIYQNEHFTFKNTNQLLDPNSNHYFEGVDGIKTGFTDEAVGA